MDKIEQLIIKNLIENPSFAKVVSPFLHKDYFDDYLSKQIIDTMFKHINKYKSISSYEQLAIDLSGDTLIDTKTVDDSVNELNTIAQVKNIDKDLDWLIDTTEKYFQMNAIKKATFEAMEIFETKDKRHKLGELPDIMRNALKLSFRNTVGTVWGTDASIEEQYKYYHSLENRYPIGNLTSFNKILRGGAQKKRLYILVAGTNVGKSLSLMNFAVQFASTGVNVLYVTLEDPEASVGERIDANRLNIESQLINTLEKEKYVSMVKKAKENMKGTVIVKEFPTTSANVNHVRALLDEVELKEGIKIDFLMLDYLNICGSIRFNKMGESYTLVKAIAEEFRGLAMERNIGVFSATQSRRDVNGNVSDFGIDAISESFGIAHTADVLIALIQPTDLRDKNQYLVKQLKNRQFAITDLNEKFLIGVDKDKQILYDLGDKNQEGLILDDTSTGNVAGTGKWNGKFKTKKYQEEQPFDAVEWDFGGK